METDNDGFIEKAIHKKATNDSALAVHDRPRIGQIMADAGLLDSTDISRVIQYQQEEGIQFGDAAVKLGLVKEEYIQNVLARQLGYPCLVPGTADLSSDLVTAYHPFDTQAEAFRSMRTYLLLEWFEKSCKPIVIVSPNRHEGRSYVCANLGVTFAQLGKRTLLIDADMRTPRQHSIFKVKGNEGLSQILSRQPDGFVPYQTKDLPGLFVISAGTIPPNPQELIAQSVFAYLVEKASEHFDVVLIDTPAADLYADAELIATQAGSALLVSNKDTTSISSIKSLTARFKNRNIEVIGSVFNHC